MQVPKSESKEALIACREAGSGGAMLERLTLNSETAAPAMTKPLRSIRASLKDTPVSTDRTVMPETLVLGIGNTLLSDEGVGIHLLNHLRQACPHPPGVRYLDGGTLSFSLAPAVEDCESLLVLDAAQLDAEPGTLRLLVGAEMDAFVGRAKRSVHEVGLADLMSIARLLNRLPVNRALLGIQPARCDWGEDLSGAVSSAIPVATDRVLALLYKWQEQADNSMHSQ
jgi:hydrogenase maturation protease